MSMLSTTANFLLVSLVAGPLLIACNSSDEAVFEDNNNNEFKPKATNLNQLDGLDAALATNDGSAKEVKEAAHVTYSLSVKTRSGAELCQDGKIKLAIMNDFSLKFPEASIKCLSLSINLAGILGAASGGDGSQQTGLGAIGHDGKTLTFKEIAGAKFDPPRPFLLGPILQDTSGFEGMDVTTEHKLTAKSKEGENIEDPAGKFRVKVHKVKTTYDYPSRKIHFDNVMHWELTSDFKTPSQYGLTFASMEWFFNVRPIMIPRLKIRGNIGDFISGDQGKLAGEITGDLEFILDVIDYEI